MTKMSPGPEQCVLVEVCVLLQGAADSLKMAPSHSFPGTHQHVAVLHSWERVCNIPAGVINQIRVNVSLQLR